MIGTNLRELQIRVKSLGMIRGILHRGAWDYGWRPDEGRKEEGRRKIVASTQSVAETAI
jgi:hypothetical protein